MELDLHQLRSLIELLRSSGVTSYRNGDLELQLGAAPAQPGEEVSISEDERPRDPVRDVLEGVGGNYSRAFEVISRG
jgi:hypothetical protein